MSGDKLVEKIDTPFGSFEDRIEAIREAQAAHEHLNPDNDDYDDAGVEGLALGSEEEEADHITEVYQDAHDDSVSVYQWGDGEDAQMFILEESRGMEDQDTAYRSRLIQEEGATYHLIQEKQGGETDVAMKTDGQQTFDVNNQEDFEDLWARLQGQDSEISNPNSLSQDSDYAAGSDYFRE